MEHPSYRPILELTRGGIRESVHFGSMAIVDSHGNLIFSHADPALITFLRSSAKPFQAIPLIENGGPEHWMLSKKEIAIMCASHAGTDDHAATIASIQTKINVGEPDLLCGSHPPIDEETTFKLRAQGAEPTQNRHNCSGKHTGMLALARMLDLPIENYINPEHPIQKRIHQTFSEMCQVDPNTITLGTDGCSAPNFAISLKNTALGFARLCDPHNLPTKRTEACQRITDAMSSHPDMVSGPGRFDTRLMEVAQGNIISKGGAEGYLCLGIKPGVIRPHSPGIGIAIKIADGDPKGRARAAVAMEVLTQLGALSAPQAQDLANFGPRLEVRNWRDIIVGESRPLFTLD